MPNRFSKPKRSKRKKRPTDPNRLAHELVRESTEEKETEEELVSRIMSKMGRKGGKIGGKKSRANMTPEQRSEAALKAAKVRWAKYAAKKASRD